MVEKKVEPNAVNLSEMDKCMKTENMIKKEYEMFIKTPKGKEWIKKLENNTPQDMKSGDFGDYLYDFYPEMLL